MQRQDIKNITLSLISMTAGLVVATQVHFFFGGSASAQPVDHFVQAHSDAGDVCSEGAFLRVVRSWAGTPPCHASLWDVNITR